MNNTLGGAVLLFPGTSRRPNEGPARHSSEALNLQVVPRSVVEANHEAFIGRGKSSRTRRGESNFPFSVLTNSLTTLEESLALAINFEEIDSCKGGT
jgi:hypothetical protein